MLLFIKDKEIEICDRVNSFFPKPFQEQERP